MKQPPPNNTSVTHKHDGRLADFLRAHRNQITPEDIGITVQRKRRVPGLRREEVAQRAGLSVSYYIRLEQGDVVSPSESVIASLARALQLNEDATTYLHRITGNISISESSPYKEDVDDSEMFFRFSDIVHHIVDCAAILFDKKNDVLAYNEHAHKIFFHHLDTGSIKQPLNTHRLLFTDPRTMDIFTNWKEEAELAVSSLIFHSATFPNDPGIQSLVQELRDVSDSFNDLWMDYPVQRCTRGIKSLRLYHAENRNSPETIEMEYQILHSPDSDGRRIIIYHPRKKS